MCFSIHQTQKVKKLCAAAQNIQALIDDGTMADAFTRGDRDATHQVVTAFDVLALNVGLVANDIKDVSPFLRYRRELFANGEVGEQLRALVLNLEGGLPGIDLNQFFDLADDYHTRIALEMIAAYSRMGADDTQLANLSAEILASECAKHAQRSEVTA